MRDRPWLRAALTLALLALAAPARAEDSSLTPEGRGQPVGPGDEVRRLTISTRTMDDARRRLALIEELQDLDRAIADLERLIADLTAERRQWEAARAQLDRQLEGVEAEIGDTRDEIEGIEQAIAASLIATAGIPNPELLAAKAVLESRLTRLKNDRAALRSERTTANQNVARLDELIDDAKARLAAKRQEKHGADARLAEVSITAPSEGARIMLGVADEIQIRANDPPAHIVVELQRGAPDLRGGTLWSTVYERTLRWQDLEAKSPSVVALRFRTGASTTGRTIHDPHGIRLEKGPHRVTVRRVGAGPRGDDRRGGGMQDPREHQGAEDPHEDARPRSGKTGGGRSGSGFMKDGGDGAPPPPERMSAPVAWRHFEVVGRLGNQAIQDAPGPGQVRVQRGKPHAPGRIDGVKRPPQMPSGGIQSPTGGDDEPETPPKLRGFPRR